MHAMWLGVLVLVAGACGPGPDRAVQKGGAGLEQARETTAAERLETDVTLLATTYADRNVSDPETLEAAGVMLERALVGMGYEPEREAFELGDAGIVFNIVVEIPGESDDIVVVGAHYDAAEGTPGADDNASGVAGVLELARRFADREGSLERTLRIVFFTTEEPPHFRMGTMGSLVHARASAERGDAIAAMISVEMIGYFDDEPGSQRYPAMPGVKAAEGLPDVGDFIGLVTRLEDGELLERIVETMRADERLAVMSMALPGYISGVGWSDHWSFWQAGYPAVMVTDTAFARNPNYHQATDTPGTLDYERMALVVDGIERAVMDLLGTSALEP